MTKLAMALLVAASLFGAERAVEPTFLHRYVPDLAAKPADVSTDTCHYTPIFGAGDSLTSIVKGVARYGEMLVAAQGACAEVTYPAEEQVYVILEGTGVLSYGPERVPIRTNDFMYLPAGVRHGVSNPSDRPCRVLVMGFKIPAGTKTTPPPRLLLANLDDVKKQTVEGHPPSVLYQLMMGDRRSTRDKLAAGYTLTSLFIMEFAPGGTNFPHHHETEEEIYLVLEGHGEIVAGGGMDGVEGRHPAQAGDAYFFRLNCTVGFYNSREPGAKARILAVRSLFPGAER
jgi:mannose-6-phosphate isomerase-like protein (cupin superfamily)